MSGNPIYVTDAWHSSVVQITGRDASVVDTDAANDPPRVTIIQIDDDLFEVDVDDRDTKYVGAHPNGEYTIRWITAVIREEFVMCRALTCFATLRWLPPWESYGNHRDRADELAAGPRRAGYEHAWDKISLIASWPVGVSAKNFFRP